MQQIRLILIYLLLCFLKYLHYSAVSEKLPGSRFLLLPSHGRRGFISAYVTCCEYTAHAQPESSVFFCLFLFYTLLSAHFIFLIIVFFSQLIFTMRKTTKTKVKQHRSKTKLKYRSDTTEGSI